MGYPGCPGKEAVKWVSVWLYSQHGEIVEEWTGNRKAILPVFSALKYWLGDRPTCLHGSAYVYTPRQGGPSRKSIAMECFSAALATEMGSAHPGRLAVQ